MILYSIAIFAAALVSSIAGLFLGNIVNFRGTNTGVAIILFLLAITIGVTLAACSGGSLVFVGVVMVGFCSGTLLRHAIN